MYAVVKDQLQRFRYLGVHDLESDPVQPSRVAWARRFCEDWQDAGNSGSAPCSAALARTPTPTPTQIPAQIPAQTDAAAFHPSLSPETIHRLPTFTLRYPHSEATRILGMNATIEWPEFHTARARGDAHSIARLLLSVDQDLAALEFGCCPVQSLSELVLALEWLRKIAASPEETQIWRHSAQILFHLSVAHGCDAQIDQAWADQLAAHDAANGGTGSHSAAEPEDAIRGEVDLPIRATHVAVLKRVATELRSVMAGSYVDARDVAHDVGVALEVIWHDLVVSAKRHDVSAPNRFVRPVSLADGAAAWAATARP